MTTVLHRPSSAALAFAFVGVVWLMILFLFVIIQLGKAESLLREAREAIPAAAWISDAGCEPTLRETAPLCARIDAFLGDSR